MHLFGDEEEGEIAFGGAPGIIWGYVYGAVFDGEGGSGVAGFLGVVVD